MPRERLADDADHEEPQRSAESAPARATAPEHILHLQRSAGNAAVARILAARAATASLAREGLVTGDQYQAARRAKEEWVAEGVRGPEDYVPSTNRGGFQVAYVPDVGDGALNIALKGAVDFVDGIEMLMGSLPFAVARQPTPQVQAAATAINALPLAQRAAAIAAWHWDDAAKATFLADFQTAVVGAWQRKYQFHCTREHWGDLGADVNVRVEMHAGAKTGDDHMGLTTYKIADTATAGNVGVVRSRAGRDAHDNEMVLNSTDVRPRTDINLTRNIGFTAGTTTILPGDTARVSDFANRYQSGGTGPICSACGQEMAALAGTRINLHVQGTGADPQAQARTRFDTLVAALVAGGMSDAATKCDFHYDGEGDGARMIVGSGLQQAVAAHEAGHMFGLQDEYTAPFSGTGVALGTPTDPGLGIAQGLPGAVAENTDSIMSVGNAVKPQHYATFLEALKHITGMSDWAVGPPTGVAPPGVDGPINPNSLPPGMPQPGEPETAMA
jgi:hypothetical protein